MSSLSPPASTTNVKHENVLSLKGLFIEEHGGDDLATMRLLAVNQHAEGLIDADSLMRSGEDGSLHGPLPL